jgi:adenine deaminase
MQGGLVVTRDGGVVESLALPLGGLVSPLPATEVAKAEERLEASVRDLGVRQPGAFIFLSFLALSVVPKLKITDRGLLDVAKWQIASVQA